MSKIISFFTKFRSIHTGEDVFAENERRANMLAAFIMLNTFIVQVIVCIMSFIGVLDTDILGTNKINIILFLAVGLIFLFIPSIICFVLNGKGKYLKFILLFLLTGTLATINSIFTYTTILTLVVPIFLASRYYSKKLTIFVAISTILMFGISSYVSSFVGWTDLNYAVIPVGTTITINTTLEDAVDELNLDQEQKTESIMFQFYLTQIIIYIFMIISSGIQLSKSGRNMVEKQKKLSEEGARIESELHIATEIQKDMLPSTFPAFPEHKEIDIYAEMTPAKEVGGDFYDMFLIDENHLAVVIADVSGKGVPAALIMMTTKTLVKNTTLNGYSVNEVFNKVNNQLCERNKSNHFVTSWFAILDLETGKLEFVNAGHNPPLIYTKKDNKFEYLKTKPNLILAAMEGTKYTKHEVTLEPGDKLFLYTDGVTEAQNGNDELYGEERLQDYLNNHIDQDVETTIKGVKKDIDSFVGKAEQFDDITMLELLFKGEKGK